MIAVKGQEKENTRPPERSHSNECGAEQIPESVPIIKRLKTEA